MAALVSCLAWPGFAQKNDPEAEQEVAISAVKQMARFIVSLDQFTVQAEVTSDEVLTDGQKIQFSKRVEIRVDLPNKLWASADSTQFNREYYYDGESLTVYSPRVGYYASFPTPPTVGETLTQAYEQYGVSWPLTDLVLWATDQSSIDDVRKAIYVGIDEVDGVVCNHYAFRQEEVDWQLCIQRGDAPLPLKMVITSILEEEQPQYVATMSWDTAPDLKQRSFTFQPRVNDHQIEFEVVEDDAMKAE